MTQKTLNELQRITKRYSKELLGNKLNNLDAG